jgi:hypothetical protein
MNAIHHTPRRDLNQSWRQQPGTPICTTDLPLDAARQALADATPEQTASWRSRPHSTES